MKYLLLVLSFSLYASLTYGALPASISDEQINQYIEKIGLKDTFESLPDQMLAMGQQQKLTSSDPAAVDQSIQEIMAVWNIEDAMAITKAYIRDHSTKEQFSDLNEWQNSSLAKTMTGQELQATQPNFQADLMHYMGVLQTNPPKQEVVSAIQNLVKNTKMTDMTVELIVSIMKSMALATGDSETEKFETMIAQMKPMLAGQMNQQMIMTSFYIYRNVSTEQLNEYADFYKSELGQHELDLMWAAFNETFKDWSVKVGTQLKNKKLAAQ